MCAGTAHGKYPGSGNPWTGLGSGNCILCKSAQKCDGNREYSGVPGQYGRCPVLWNRVYGVPKTWRNLLCRSVWDRHPGGFGSVPGSKILDGDGTGRIVCLYRAVFDFYGSRQHSCLFADYDSGKRRRNETAEGGRIELLK